MSRPNFTSIIAATSPRPSPMSGRLSRTAFSLVELLVVIFIVAVVIAITLPALGGARDAAKAATTRALLQDISRASDTFAIDNRRVAGYFTPREMGLSSNGSATNGRGLSGMENLMLDLAGGIVQVGGDKPVASTFGETVEAAPFDPASSSENKARVAWVNPKLIGAPGKGNSKSYFTPDPKFFVEQPGGGNSVAIRAQFGQPGATAAVGELQIPDIVDAFGNPVLAWTQDETATDPITEFDNFAKEESELDDDSPARFYWNQNAAFLRATSLGRLKRDQTLNGTNPYSLIGAGVSDYQYEVNLSTLLGNPGFPNTLEDGKDVLPTTPRGKLVFHAAGADGYYLGDKDVGGKLGGGTDRRNLFYSFNFFGTDAKTAKTAQRLKDKDGKDANRDIISLFDDVVIATGS